jgi:hypothetical protein
MHSQTSQINRYQCRRGCLAAGKSKRKTNDRGEMDIAFGENPNQSGRTRQCTEHAESGGSDRCQDEREEKDPKKKPRDTEDMLRTISIDG